ncbi:uncharacterized protein Z520_07329 [Fonsecaea multimorphosa CBS 102226]|uniref:UmuC domain-containing protein n=1 Tax=Fonsecaea multimorphosa CBS 102226 TaxID=1442371 RepID=A0A0D2K2C8_9EURO|nr:uncharacterized protein Z520_07329 [Fonsecaea multimorphosa CBS 102226]KIX97214.1 hypothetical protein Z520_07329 [Fonsecaea multimorphosa CBS 102226]OAL22987.1 hypothetical protein AYO22_06895 [Fonsecaea multimorphosa]
MHRPPGQQRVIIHFDYDCFYASVVENENPALKSVPLAVQQKQIVVTCNYEARRRGLRKLQLITEAKKVCPEVVIVLGEDLTRFRDASKDLYNFVQQSIWSGKAERLGFDEVWLDCTDMVDYNMGLLNLNDLSHSFFCMSRDDPTVGFTYDASSVYGPTYPSNPPPSVQLSSEDEELRLRLVLGSHLARHLRHELESQKGYTSTVGIAMNKLLAKLAGNVNKPKNQTTILPPCEPNGSVESNITRFLDDHDIGKIPGIGFKLAQKIRAHVLGRDAAFAEGLVYGGTKESVTVLDVRSYPGMGPKLLDDILAGPGSSKGIGGRIWDLINGVDDSEVAKVKRVPSQISQEDSYMKYLHTFEQVKNQLQILGERLIRRMQIDLLEDADDDGRGAGENPRRRWMAHPRTLRLSTRPRPLLGPDGARARTFQRSSRSGPMPNFVFSLNETTSALAQRLVEEALVPMFRKLHHEHASWNLSLINIAATNMAETAAETKESQGRDIGRMFRRQDEVLKDFRVTVHPDEAEHTESAIPNSPAAQSPDTVRTGSDIGMPAENDWDSEDGESQPLERCEICENAIPAFALAAHQRYHELSN